jgi:hypothetical protein
MIALFFFDLGTGQPTIYRVKDVLLPSNTELLTAIGFVFMSSQVSEHGAQVDVLIPARHLLNISYYTRFDLLGDFYCNDTASVKLIHA